MCDLILAKYFWDKIIDSTIYNTCFMWAKISKNLDKLYDLYHYFQRFQYKLTTTNNDINKKKQTLLHTLICIIENASKSSINVELAVNPVNQYLHVFQ